MAINIKEIFENDSENQRIDKINYNFDQILANGGGPVGASGPQGNVGATGANGPQGVQGAVGPKGDAGDYTDFFVVEDSAALVYNSISTKAVVDPTDPGIFYVPSLTIGDPNSRSNGNTNLFRDAAVRLIGQNFFSNVARLEADITGGNYIDINLTDSGSERTLSFNPSASGAGSNTKYEFKGSVLKLSSGNVDAVTLGTSESVFDVNVKLNAGAKLPSGASSGKVLSSTDNQGTFAWTDPGVVPIGTMVMVPGFVLVNAVNWTGINNPTYDYKGRGIDGGTYGNWEGWYFCYGKTWGSYATPNMMDRYPLGVTTNNGSGADIAGGSNTSSDTISVADHRHTITSSTGTDSFISGGAPATYIDGVNGLSGLDGGFSKTVNIDINPKHITVGYMIYLENSDLTYSTSGGGAGSFGGN